MHPLDSKSVLVNLTDTWHAADDKQVCSTPSAHVGIHRIASVPVHRGFTYRRSLSFDPSVSDFEMLSESVNVSTRVVSPQIPYSNQRYDDAATPRQRVS